MPPARYWRFVIHRLDNTSKRRRGIFQAAIDLRDAGTLPDPLQAQLVDLLRWFGAHLKIPTRFAHSRKSRASPRAICWIRESATAHLQKLRALTVILESAAIAVDVLRTTRPGYLAYEDEHQVAALPFSETAT